MRVSAIDEYVDFLRSGVNTTITAGFAVVGSLVMLFFYDPLLGLVAAAVAVPVALINGRLMRRSARIYRALSDQSEREVSLIDGGSVKGVRRRGVIASEDPDYLVSWPTSLRRTGPRSIDGVPTSSDR
jgi:ABC-type multidrug transport system fused ATPase/permease subunit